MRTESRSGLTLKGRFRVGEFVVEPQLNSVRKGSDTQRIEPKMMQVLVTLTGQAGEVLSKESLMQAVWPDTFVGDDVLVRCISEIRHLFNDDPRSPHIIQTIPKVGYRFIAPVEPDNSPETPSPNVDSEPIAAATPVSVPQRSETAQSGKPRIRTLIPLLALIVLVIAGAIWGFHLTNRKGDDFTKFRTIPFTSYPGSERQPAFAPDGSKVAFAWNGPENSDFWSIYVKLIGSDTPVRLTSAQAEDLSPTWSPDGKWIAFLRHSNSDKGVFVVPAIGGPEQKLYSINGTIDWDEPGMSWSPDGKFLLFPEGKSQENPSAICRLSLDSHEAKFLTEPPKSWDGDYSPAYSPDGSMIAFVRGADVASRNIYVMDANGGAVKQLTSGGREVFGLTWMRDGKSIVYSSDLAGTVALWKVSVNGGTPERLPFGNDKAFTPAISAQGDRLAYSQNFSTWNLMQIDLKDPRKEAAKLASSTERDSAATFSPDAKRIAFESWRSGTQEIWVARADGSGSIQLTSFNGPLTGSPSWSPDGQKITFDSRPTGRAHIYAISADGGTPQALTNGEFNDIIPSWSRNGEWVYFGSKRTTNWEIWKVSTKSGDLQQVTTAGGFVGRESRDGQWVYFTKYGVTGLWKMPAKGGPEIKVVDGPPPSFWGYWNVTNEGIYYLDSEGPRMALRFKNASTGVTTTIFTFARMPAKYSGISISPDQQLVLYTDYSAIGNNIVLIESHP